MAKTHSFPLITALLLGLCAISHAQVTDKGNFLVGATIGLSAAQSQVQAQIEGQTPVDTDGDAIQFSISPRIGYFLGQNFVLGIGMDYSLNRRSEPQDVSNPTSGRDKDFDSDLLFGPFGRYYLPVGDDKAFFLEAAFGFGSSVDEITLGGVDQTTSTNVFSASIGPGFTIFSTDAIGIEALVKYNFARSSFDIDFQGTRQETLTYTNAVDLSLGIQFYFTRVAPAGRASDQPTPAGTNFY